MRNEITTSFLSLRYDCGAFDTTLAWNKTDPLKFVDNQEMATQQLRGLEV